MSGLCLELAHHWRLLPLIIVLGLGSGLPFGYHLSVTSSSSPFVRNFINQTWIRRYGFPVPEKTLTLLWSTTASVLSLGGLLGSLASGYLTQRFGKRPSHVVSSSVGIAASLFFGFSKMVGSYEMIVVGRLLYGISIGLGVNIYVQYLGEIAPRNLRGITNATGPLFVTMGKLFGQVVGLSEVLGTEELWPLMLSLCGFTDLFHLIVMRFYPETPAYLLLVKRDQERCMRAVRRIWGHGVHQLEFDDIRAQEEIRKNTKNKTVLEVIKDPSMFWQLWTVVIITISLQLSGINAIFFYARSVFLTAGLPKEKIPYIILGMGSFELLAVMLCSVLIQHCGRKTLLLGSYGLMAIMLALLTVTLSFQDWKDWMPYCSVLLIFLYIFFFGVGPGTLTLAIVIEMCSLSTRAAVFVIISCLNWTNFYLIGMAFPHIQHALGHYCFLLFLVVMVASGTFLFFILPETKGKTSQQITLEFNKLNFRGLKAQKSTELSTSF
ncbi:solute carrier family 2, facilitated glucose transporter member 9-like [Mantella aurantiaca]